MNDFAGSRFDLSNAKSIVNLALDVSKYPETGPLLSDLMYTLTRVPNPTRIFFGVGSRFFKPARKRQLQLWKALDSHLSQLDGLKQVVLLSVYTPYFIIDDLDDDSLYLDSESDSDSYQKEVNIIEKRLLESAEEKLSACRDRGLLKVKHLGVEGMGWNAEWAPMAFGSEVIPG